MVPRNLSSRYTLACDILKITLLTNYCDYLYEWYSNHLECELLSCEKLIRWLFAFIFFTQRVMYTILTFWVNRYFTLSAYITREISSTTNIVLDYYFYSVAWVRDLIFLCWNGICFTLFHFNSTPPSVQQFLSYKKCTIRVRCSLSVCSGCH